MINIKNFDSTLLKLDKKSYKNIAIYYNGYITKNDKYTKSIWAYNFIINKITRSLNIIFVDKKYDVIILSYYIFNFTC